MIATDESGQPPVDVYRTTTNGSVKLLIAARGLKATAAPLLAYGPDTPVIHEVMDGYVKALETGQLVSLASSNRLATRVRMIGIKALDHNGSMQLVVARDELAKLKCL